MWYLEETVDQNAMREYLTLTAFSLFLIGCNQSDLEALRAENNTLKEQISILKKEAKQFQQSAIMAAAEAKLAQSKAAEAAAEAQRQLERCQGK